jgi:hypothetical protein
MHRGRPLKNSSRDGRDLMVTPSIARAFCTGNLGSGGLNLNLKILIWRHPQRNRFSGAAKDLVYNWLFASAKLHHYRNSPSQSAEVSYACGNLCLDAAVDDGS